MRRIAAVLLAIALSPGAAGPAAGQGCGPPEAMSDGWPVATAAQKGLDAGLICAITPNLRNWPEADANGVVIAKAGALVYEQYFAGADARWPQQHWGERLVVQPHDARTRHDLQSITKSIVALLVGIAFDRGWLKDIDASIFSLLPQYADLRAPGKDRISLRDLLTMRSGLFWPQQPYLAMARRMEAAPDAYRFVLEQPLAEAPGASWHYNNGGVELVAAIVQHAANRPLDQFAREALFEPLGITDWEWGRMADGNPGASWGLRLRPRDLAKIGQLVLDRGAWRGRQIVSAAWIEQMLMPRVVRPGFSYGYLWWLGRVTVGGRTVDRVETSGWGGQSLTVVGAADLVVAVTAGAYDYQGGASQDLAGHAVLDAYALPAALGR